VIPREGVESDPPDIVSADIGFVIPREGVESKRGPFTLFEVRCRCA